MKKRWCIVIFSAGTLVGWTIKPHSHGAAKDESFATATKAARDRKSEPAMDAHARKWQSLGKRASTFSSEERQSFLKDLVSGDRSKALDALTTQVGPGSSSFQVTSTMAEILKSWAKEDLDGALAYCGKCPNDGIRKFMMGEILEIMVEKAPDRAVELFAQQVAEDPSFQSNVVFKLAQTMMGGNAGQLVSLISRLPMKSGSSYTGVEFSKDYDFQLAADCIAGLIKDNPGKSPAVLPMNLLGTWAGRDPEAAYAWWRKSGSLDGDPTSGYNNWGSIFEGVEKHSSPEAAAAWVVAKLEEPGAPREKMIRDLSFSSADSRAGKFNTIARAMPDVPAQDRFLSDVILYHWTSLGERGYGFAISGLSSPQTRLEVFQQIDNKNQIPDLKSISDAQFQAWGLNRKQVEQMFKISE